MPSGLTYYLYTLAYNNMIVLCYRYYPFEVTQNQTDHLRMRATGLGVRVHEESLPSGLANYIYTLAYEYHDILYVVLYF